MCYIRSTYADDYLETKPEIDKERIGYAGGSMGGILGVIFIGVEPRIKAAALIVAGGTTNADKIIRKSNKKLNYALRQ